MGRFFLCLLFSCGEQKSKSKFIQPAIYHWKSNWDPDSTEIQFLTDLKIQKVYLRFFDVDIENGKTVPKAVLTTPGWNQKTDCIPVVFITNRSLFTSDTTAILLLADQISKKIKAMATRYAIPFQEIQMDCDWTNKTRKAYFLLLKRIKENLNVNLSATIRLHQIKFMEQTGIPPADRGMLMCYNVEDVRAFQTRNSIFDPYLIQNYLKRIPEYPLPLDLALPLFHWTVVHRNRKFIRILNAVGEKTLQSKDYLQKTNDKTRYVSLTDSLDFSMNIRKGDVFRLEWSPPDEVKTIKTKALHLIRNQDVSLTYYHLDQQVLSSFDSSYLHSLYENPIP